MLEDNSDKFVRVKRSDKYLSGIVADKTITDETIINEDVIDFLDGEHISEIEGSNTTESGNIVLDIAGVKLVHLAPYIYNVNNFYFRDHPVYHPDTREYIEYWEVHEKRSCEGYWGLDQKEETDKYNKNKDGGWRYMTPQHYWYANFNFLQDEDDNGIMNTFQPSIRDIDWYIFYAYLKAIGFSGFENDDEVSCSEILKKYIDSDYTEDNFTPKDKLLFSKLMKTGELLKKDGKTFKSYAEPIEYLKGTFTKPLGKPLYSNPRKNLFLLSTRGIGKSYSISGIISQTYNYYGQFYYEDYLDVKKGATICVGSALSSKSGSLLEKFKFSQDQLAENFGAYYDEINDEFIPGFFHKEFKGSLDSGNEKNPYRHEYKIKRNGVWISRGTKTNIVHGSYETNTEVFVGKRAALMVEEEVGLNGKILDSHKADETVMIVKNKIGTGVKIGTGGNIKKITGCKIIFNNPRSYSYLEFKNHWEPTDKAIGMFIPSYYTDSSFRDENGNQNIELALEQEMHVRKELAEADDTTVLDGYVTARPLKPSEMFLAPEHNIFPISKLREHKASEEALDVFKKITSIGRLEFINKEKSRVKWINDNDRYKPPIKTFDLSPYNGHYQGSIVIYEHPEDNIPDPIYNRSLYKVVYDPYRDDKGGPSLASILVYKGYTSGWNDGLQGTIVAEIFGRRSDVLEMHEIAIKLAIYYNAKVLYENNLPGFLNYCKMSNNLHMLQVTPYNAIETVIKHGTRKHQFGVSMNKSLIIHCEQLLNKWFLEKRQGGMLQLHHVHSPRILDEAINYTRENNTDGISAMFLLMLWLAQEEIVSIKEKTIEDKKNDINSFFNELTRINNREENSLNQYNIKIKNAFHEY